MKPTEPGTMTPAEPHVCTEPDHHWDPELNMCVPNAPITETALRLSQAKVDATNATIQLKTTEQQRDHWKNVYQQTLAQNLQHETKIKTLEQRIEKLETLRNEAQRNFLNEQTEREKAVSKHRLEVANREEYREQAEQWKHAHEQLSRKYNASLGTNLDLSKKVTKSNEDYLDAAAKIEYLEKQLNKAKDIGRKLKKLKTEIRV